VTSVDLFGDPPARRLSNGYAGHVGLGPKGETCRSCRHSRATGHGQRNYWKCDLVRVTRGPGTDIRLRTPACERWEKETGPEEGPELVTLPIG
jgi:hypothetical protein